MEQPAPSPNARVQPSVYSDISPPDSPAYATIHGHSPHDVSPVDDRPVSLPKSRKQTDSAQKSSLPVPRKAVTSPEGPIQKFDNSPGWRRNANAEGTTRWDDYSGEPTTSETGRQASVQPGSVEAIASTREKSKQLKTAFRDRDPARRRASSKTETDPSVLPPEREPWKGASGRTTLVKPLKDDPSKKLAPIKIPQSPPPQNGTFKTPTELSESKNKKGRRRISFDSTPYSSGDENIKPVVPLKAGTNSPRMMSPVNSSVSFPYVSSPVSATPTDQHPQSPALPPTGQRSRSPAMAQITKRPSPIQVPPSQLREEHRSDSPSTPQNLEHLQHLEVDDQPGSRFSATTIATTAHDSDSSPRPSFDAPPVPVIPADLRQDTPSPRSFFRPTWEPSSPKLVVRKPVTPAPRAATLDTVTSLVSKSLPQCPPEMQAIDKIASLEARLDDLAGRRRNINKILKGLSNVVNPSSPGYDFKSKSEVKQTIASLKNELADIGQDEHTTSLMLHRAQKRRDREMCYGQPTGLWVRRITS